MDFSPPQLASDPARMGAAEAASLIHSKAMSSEELVRACLVRIRAHVLL